MLSEIGVSQMPSYYIFYLKKQAMRFFYKVFYVWIVFYYNNYEQNLIHPLWIGYNVPLSQLWWNFNRNLTIFGCFMGIKRNRCNLTSRNLNTLPSAPLILFKLSCVTEGVKCRHDKPSPCFSPLSIINGSDKSFPILILHLTFFSVISVSDIIKIKGKPGKV